MAWGWGEEDQRWGARARRPAPDTPPPPARAAAAAGASRAGQENGRWARGGLSPAAPPPTRDAGSEPGVEGGARTPPGNPLLPIAFFGAQAASVSPSTPSHGPSLSHPTGAPHADDSGTWRPGLAPPPPRPGPTRALWESSPPHRPAAPRPHGRALTQSRLRGRQAARAEARRRRQRRAGSREAGGGGGPSARRWRDPRLPPTPRWRPSRLLLRPAKSGTFKNPCARNRPPARPRALPPPSAPPRPLRAPQRPPEGPGPPSSRPQDRPAAAQASRGAPNRRGAGPERGAGLSDRACAPQGRGRGRGGACAAQAAAPRGAGRGRPAGAR
ncbi:basic salivary proline-rich protein 2-like [Acinonyx jubatus]|uniref:Basic salivary proline-rich protein 2-like n=1 Tax=Acinonyx jubatus TaxID=32536 RepID=A0A6J1Y7Y2_ACIJB|nr:basic salivary proline-rich protein 2-like [Acinonyx jubatus]